MTNNYMTWRGCYVDSKICRVTCNYDSLRQNYTLWQAAWYSTQGCKSILCLEVKKIGFLGHTQGSLICASGEHRSQAQNPTHNISAKKVKHSKKVKYIYFTFFTVLLSWDFLASICRQILVRFCACLYFLIFCLTVLC